jgi:hypothetical protein
MKIQSGTPRAQSTQSTERTELRKDTGSKREPVRSKLRDGFAASEVDSTTRAASAAKLQGQSGQPKVEVHQKVGEVKAGGKLVGVDAGSLSNGVYDIRQDVARNAGEVVGALVEGDVTSSTLTINQKIGKDEGKTTAARIGGDVVDSVIIANGKVEVDGDVRGSIIVVDNPSDLVVKGKISPDTKVMTPAQYEQYQREHRLPAAGTR